jgi:hypothetical protein
MLGKARCRWLRQFHRGSVFVTRRDIKFEVQR